MKRLLLLATTTGYQTSVFRDAAEMMGVPLALATDRCHVLEDPWRDGAIAVRFQEPYESAERIVEFSRDQEIAGMVAVGDIPTLTAALACRMLGIEHNPPVSVEVCRNKFLMRERYAAAGLPTPWYTRFQAAADPGDAARQVSYPCVLKPLGLSGSRGVIRADNPAEFAAAFQRIRGLLETADVRMLADEGPAWIQVEGYIPGTEVAVEGLLTRGKLRVLAIFDKPDPLEGPYFEETIYVTPSRLPEETQRQIVQTLERAVAAAGLWHGPLHAEMRINDQGVWMLEMAARPIGGLCARALRFGDGVALEELLLRHALGEPVHDMPRETAASGVMMIPIPQAGVYEGVENLEAAEQVPGIESIRITAKFRQKIYPMPEGSSYLGFIFARGETPRFVEAALREAHMRLKFVFTPDLPVVGTKRSTAE